MQSADSYDNYAQYGYNSKIDGGAKNYFGAARRSGVSGEWLYRSILYFNKKLFCQFLTKF
jgi:hypothetical protein